MEIVPKWDRECERFLICLAEAEAGDLEALQVLKSLLAESDAVNALLEEDDTVAVRFALVSDCL